MIVAAASDARRAHTPESAAADLYRWVDESDPAGERPISAWERLDDAGVPTGEGELRPTLGAGVSAGEFVVLTDRGLFRSRHGGSQFRAVDVGWPAAFRDRTTCGLAGVGWPAPRVYIRIRGHPAYALKTAPRRAAVVRHVDAGSGECRPFATPRTEKVFDRPAGRRQ